MTFERETLPNGIRLLTAPMPHAQSVSCFLMFAAGSRYETQGHERHRPLRRAHVLQGHRAAADRARHRRGDRLDRRRVQRLHEQGVHGLLRQVRGRPPRHRPRRARRHDPALEVRRRGDRPREGRHRRGDEHVLRHAARLHRRRLRVAALRRPAPRLGHHRPQGDGAGGHPGHLHRLPRTLVPAVAHRRRPGRAHRRRAHGASSGSSSATWRTATATPVRRRWRRTRTASSRSTRRTPTRPTSSSVRPATRSRTRTATC